MEAEGAARLYGRSIEKHKFRQIQVYSICGGWRQQELFKRLQVIAIWSRCNYP